MTFEVIPSVDILDGQVVRLERGDLSVKTVYGDDPVSVAKDWEAQGATRIHVVDLGGAVSGEPRGHEQVEAIVRSVSIPVQVAGGIRTIDAAKAWVAAGADRVVLGTNALIDESFLLTAIDVLGPRLVVAPDAEGREVRVAGWREGTGEDVADAAKRLAAAGVPRLLVTDIAQDGMLAGPNVSLLAEVARAAGIPVIASGGVSSIDDLRVLAATEGIEAAIVGKALYAGAIELPRALEAVA